MINPVLNGYVLETLESHGLVDVIFTDFNDAFDHVNHAKLIKVLNIS